MEPQIRYVQSADGTRIATWNLGEGRPLIYLTFWFYTIEMLWRIPEARANIERLALQRKVVLYDPRGAGLSSRDTSDFSLEARVGDLDAVVVSLGDGEVDLMGGIRTSSVAITYAARHVQKVRRIALSDPRVRGQGLLTMDERLRVLEPLAEMDWDAYLQCRSVILFGWTDLGRRVAQQQAKEVSREVHVKSSEATSQDDVTSLLPLVRCPTLVMVRRSGRALPLPANSTEVAAGLPNARLVTYQQDHIMFIGGEWDSALRTVAEFFDEDEKTYQPAIPSGTSIILFADIADSTALTERLGDAAFRDKARELDEALRRAITSNGGTAIDGKLLGDGVLATFGAAREAIACAQACHESASASQLTLHVGIHAGDVIRESNNAYGGAVNIAARISNEAPAGETLVSDIVRGLARTSAGVTFEDRGERELKGVSDPVRLFAVLPD